MYFQKYESFKDGLPDISWMNSYLPDQEQLNTISERIQRFRNQISLQEKLGLLKVCFYVLNWSAFSAVPNDISRVYSCCGVFNFEPVYFRAWELRAAPAVAQLA